MISSGGNFSTQQVQRVDYHHSESQQAATDPQYVKARTERPVEADGQSAEAKLGPRDSSPHKYNVEEGKVVYERYDKNGEVVYRQPPDKVNAVA